MDNRVKVIAGDVSLLYLGLSEEDYLFLTYEVDTVIHAAAYVNLIYPYQAYSVSQYHVFIMYLVVMYVDEFP